MPDSKLWMYVKQEFKSLNKARKLQAKEYKRRLKKLNGEAATLHNMQATYTPREVFDRTIDELRETGSKRDDAIKTIQLWISNQEGKAARSQLIAIVSIVVSIIAVALSFIKK